MHDEGRRELTEIIRKARATSGRVNSLLAAAMALESFVTKLDRVEVGDLGTGVDGEVTARIALDELADRAWKVAGELRSQAAELPDY